MEIQFTLSQIVGMATVVTAIITTYNLIRKPLKEREKSEADVGYIRTIVNSSLKDMWQGGLL